jgi:SOS-response transcriptional repressor LexA
MVIEKERSSKKQREMLNFVAGFIQAHGYGPSYREIMRSLGYKSVSTVAVHIDGLISRGYLNKRDNSARSLEVVTTHIDSTPVHKTPTTSQEKWLVSAIIDRFDHLEKTKDQSELDGLYVLVGALKVLGLDGAHMAMRTRLIEIVKANNSKSK